MSLPVLLVSLTVAAGFVFKRLRKPRHQLPLPPGPKKLPIIGNLLDIPNERQWLAYHQWSQDYDSDIIHVDACGTSIVVVESVEAVRELFDRRSSIYSDRMHLPMVVDLMGWDWSMAFMPYGERWRAHRKTMHDSFNVIAVKQFQSQEVHASNELLRSLLLDPNDVVAHFRQRMDLQFLHSLSMLLRLMTIQTPQQSETVRNVAAAIYAAGADTTAAALGWFVFAMLAYPETQAKAQAELDAILGHGVLPTFADQQVLPYVAALVKEVLRWRTITPIAVPHFVAAEDEYRGYRIPARSIVLGNAWAILHDKVIPPQELHLLMPLKFRLIQDAYPNPDEFNPERFLRDGKLNPKVQDPEVAVFGFGRRICPGRHMATASVWLSITSILATFKIAKAVNESGEPVEPTYDYFAGLICAPLPFKCSVMPRSLQTAEAIRSLNGHEI
ncbi:Cytochrome P450 [Mycena chlorophos]|uniref:Cytochrome P450 n=1 Tax=Mycena chlorophos TaxID=658473 RepID=A0A8H6SBA3_MYCCL|nr:Cytochrome P450 [Mycena chlorophos]